MDALIGLLGDLRTHRRLSLVEMLLVLPALLLALWCLGTWSVYFWLSMEAGRGADLALAAIREAPDRADSEAVARGAARRALSAPISDVLIERRAGQLAVRLVFDVSANPIFTAPGPSPLPPTAIVAFSSTR